MSTHSGDFGELENFVFSTFKKTHLSNCPQLGLRQHVTHRKTSQNRTGDACEASGDTKTPETRRELNLGKYRNSIFRLQKFQIFGFPDLVDPADLGFAGSSHR